VVTDLIGAFKAPLYHGWQFTHRCNAKSRYCYTDSGPSVNCTKELNREESLGHR